MKKIKDMIDSISPYLKKLNDIFSFCKNINTVWTIISGAVLFVVGFVIDKLRPEYVCRNIMLR